MPNLFDIRAVATRVPLDANRKGEASFAVTNTGGVAVRGRVLLKADNPDVLPYLSLEGEVERDYATGQSRQYTVKIEAPSSAAPGEYTFHLDALDVLNPDDRYVVGPEVTFEVPEPPKPQPQVPWWKKIPWWVYAAVAGGIVLIVVLIVLLTRPREPASLIAHFPLRDNTSDITGHADPMWLHNTPFKDGGIEVNGIYWGNPGYSQAQTSGWFPAISTTVFSIAATFKPAEIRRMPVFDADWAGFEMYANGHVGIKYAYNQYFECSNSPLQTGKWYKGMITYNGSSIFLYLDGNQICSQPAPPASVYSVGLTDWGLSATYKGIFKDLKLYNEALVP